MHWLMLFLRSCNNTLKQGNLDLNASITVLSLIEATAACVCYCTTQDKHNKSDGFKQLDLTRDKVEIVTTFR